MAAQNPIREKNRRRLDRLLLLVETKAVDLLGTTGHQSCVIEIHAKDGKIEAWKASLTAGGRFTEAED